MKKGRKIKRYSQKKSFSPRPNKSPWQILLFVAIVVALVFVGISIYKPVSDFLGGRTKPTPMAESSIPSLVEPLPEPEPIITPPPSPLPEPAPAPVVLGQSVQGKLLPLAVAQDPVALVSFLEQLPAHYNAVVFETKTKLGEITYESANPQAVAWKAIIPNPVDLGALAKTLNEKNLHLVTKMAVFSDPIAARGDLEHNGILHSSGVIWIDNTLANGGKPWTTPYSTSVREYNTALAIEMKDFGSEMMLLDYVQFPKDPTNSARFGGDGSQLPAEALISMIDAVKAATQVSTGVIAPYGSTYADERTNNAYYGGNPLTLSADTLVFDMLGEEFLQNGEVNPYVLEVALRAKETSQHVIYILRSNQLPENGTDQSYVLYD